jgi:hypothetical protein
MVLLTQEETWHKKLTTNNKGDLEYGSPLLFIGRLAYLSIEPITFCPKAFKASFSKAPPATLA